MSKMTGLLVAGGVFGAVAASALATSVAPAPAQALDACFSSGLTGTLKTGSASCSSSGPLQWAIAIGANTTAEVGDGLFNLAIAVGDNSEAYASRGAQSVRGGYFNIATAAAGGTAQASDGIFQIANARGEGSGAFARYGSFGVARAIGVNAFAQAAAEGDLPLSAFNIAVARGENSSAFALRGFGNSSRAFGSDASATAGYGNGNIARALGNGAVAEARGDASGARLGSHLRGGMCRLRLPCCGHVQKTIEDGESFGAGRASPAAPSGGLRDCAVGYPLWSRWTPPESERFGSQWPWLPPWRWRPCSFTRVSAPAARQKRPAS